MFYSVSEIDDISLASRLYLTENNVPALCLTVFDWTTLGYIKKQGKQWFLLLILVLIYRNLDKVHILVFCGVMLQHNPFAQNTQSQTQPQATWSFFGSFFWAEVGLYCTCYFNILISRWWVKQPYHCIHRVINVWTGLVGCCLQRTRVSVDSTTQSVCIRMVFPHLEWALS